MLNKFIVGLIVLLGMSVHSSASTGPISIENGRIRLLPPSAPATGAFVTISNSSDKDIKLIKAKSNKSKVTELHNHFKVDGMMKMREVPFIKVPAKGSVQLKPGSFHVMLINLNSPLKLGEKIDITFEFDNGQKIVKRLEVKKIKMMMKHKMKH